MKHEALTDRIIGCVVEVHRALGPGFMENVYRRALELELDAAGLQVERGREVQVFYRDQEVGRHRLELVVEALIVIELKAVSDLAAAHYEQVRAYLRASGLEVGLLVNFGRERSDVRRVEWPPAVGHGRLGGSL